jgi:hypothetical protein
MVSVDQVSAGAHTAVAQLAKSGGLTLTLDGKASITSTDAGRMFSAMPVDGLDVGADEGGLVGPYTGSNRFKGDIESVVITIQDP